MRNNRRFKALLLIFLIALFLVGCTDVQIESSPNVGNEEYNQNEMDQENGILGELQEVKLVPLSSDEMSFLQDGMTGTNFMVRALTSDLNVPFYGNIVLESNEDMLLAQLGHLAQGDAERSYLMKVFLNYEEVAFRLEGEENYVTEILFSVPAGYEAHVPFVLDFEPPNIDYTHALTVVVFENTHLHFADFSEEMTIDLWGGNVGAMGLSFDVSYGSGGEIKLSVPYTEPLSRHEDMWFHQVGINQNLNDFNYVALPEQHIQVKKNEEIEFYWWANIHTESDLENYVIFALLDWQQIEMNEVPYLFIPVEDDNRELVDHGALTIQAPNEIGRYEFIAFIVPNATRKQEISNFFPLEFTRRFTIEVVE